MNTEEGDEVHAKGLENIFDEIIAENFPGINKEPSSTGSF
jgi:hypothetical protein